MSKLNIRIIYQKNYQAECEAKKNCNVSVNSDQNKIALISYLSKEFPFSDGKGGKQHAPYKPIVNYQFPQNCALQLTLQHSFIRLQQGPEITLKIYQIYLIDHLQTKINLGNYKNSVNNEDLTYKQQFKLSDNSKEYEYKIIIYSTSFFDPSSCEDGQNKNLNNKNPEKVIDLDDFQYMNNINQFGEYENQRPNQEYSPAISIKASFKQEIKKNYKGQQIQSPLKNSEKINSNNQFLSDQKKKLADESIDSKDLNSSVISEDGNIIEEDVEQPNQSLMKNIINFSEMTIQDIKFRFGDFRSEIIDNLLLLSKSFNQEQILENIDDLDKKPDQKIKKEIQEKYQSQIQPKQNNIIQQELVVTIQNFALKDIVLDLFPFHDEEVRKQLPKVFQKISQDNDKKAFYTNQRSIIRLQSLTMKKLEYSSLSEKLEFQVTIHGLGLYTLIFKDQIQELNPLILQRQNQFQKELNNQEQLQNDKKGYVFADQIGRLGYQNIIETTCQLSFLQDSKQNKFILQLEKSEFIINTCKDTILAFPLHITLLSLLFQRMFSPLLKEQEKEQILNQSKGLSNNQNQNVSLQQSINQQMKNQNNNMEIQQEKKKNLAEEYDFEEFGEEFMDVEEEFQKEENENKKFIQDAKDQGLQYFHLQNFQDQQASVQVELNVQNFEIYIHSGKDFDFEDNQKPQKAERRRNSSRDYKQNLFLVLDQIEVLYSQFPTQKKINLCIKSIDLQGTVDNQSQTIIRKKNKLKQMLLLDVTIHDVKRLISSRIYLARIQIVIDKVHKQLFDDLSSMQIDFDQIAVSKENKKMDQSEISIFNNASKLIDQENDGFKEIELKDESDIDGYYGDYEICDLNTIAELNDEKQKQFKFQIIHISPIEFEITVNWYVNSILKDSQLVFDQLYLSNESGIPIDPYLILNMQNHYTKLFNLHISKDNQLLKIIKDVVLIRNFSNIAKSLANVFILPYKSFKSNGMITSGFIEGIKGFQHSIFDETKNLFGLVYNIYSSYRRSNIMGFGNIKKYLKNKNKNQ